MADATKKAAPRPKRPGSPRKTPRTAVQFICWTVSGEPMPESVLRNLDEAMQREMERSRVRLTGTVVKV